MDIVGKVIQVLPLQSGVSANSGKAWSLKTFILELPSNGNFTRKVAVEIFGEQRIADNPVEIDQTVTVSFDLESREFNGRWYTSVRAWKIQQGIVTQPAAPTAIAAPTVPQAGAPAAAATAAPAPAAAPAVQPFDAAADNQLDATEGLPF